MSAAEATLTWSAIGVLIALMVLWSGVVLVAVKWIVSGSEKHLEQRFRVLEENVRRGDDSRAALSRQLQNQAVEMPKEYVRREDWIRFSTTILASVDRVGARIDEEMTELRGMLEAMNKPRAERKSD